MSSRIMRWKKASLRPTAEAKLASGKRCEELCEELCEVRGAKYNATGVTVDHKRIVVS